MSPAKSWKRRERLLPCTKPEVCTRCFADHTDCANSPPLIKSLSVPRQGDTLVTAAGFRLVDGYKYIHQLHEQDATPVVFMLVLRLRPYRPNSFPPTCLLSHSTTIPPRSHRERSNWAELPTLGELKQTSPKFHRILGMTSTFVGLIVP